MTEEIISAAQDAEELYAAGDRPDGQAPARKLTIGSLYIFYKPKTKTETSDPIHFIEDLRATFEAGALNTEDAETTVAALTEAWQAELKDKPVLMQPTAPAQHVFIGLMHSLNIFDQRAELTAQPA